MQKDSKTPRAGYERWTLGPLTSQEVLALPASVDFVDASRALGLSKFMAYELVKQGRYPVPLLPLGRIRKVRRADLLKHLGISEGSTAAADGGDAA